LFFVAFLPLPTRLVGEYVREGGAERVAVTVYGLVLLTMHLALTLLWRYALAAHLTRADADPGRVRALTDKLTPSAGFYLFALAIGLLFPIAATALYLLIAVYMYLPLRLFLRARRGRRA
jgi:uncharacterized membrane protein